MDERTVVGTNISVAGTLPVGCRVELLVSNR